MHLPNVVAVFRVFSEWFLGNHQSGQETGVWKPVVFWIPIERTLKHSIDIATCLKILFDLIRAASLREFVAYIYDMYESRCIPSTPPSFNSEKKLVTGSTWLCSVHLIRHRATCTTPRYYTRKSQLNAHSPFQCRVLPLLCSMMGSYSPHDTPRADFSWTTGNSTKLAHRRLIASGAFGDVHEVFSHW